MKPKGSYNTFAGNMGQEYGRRRPPARSSRLQYKRLLNLNKSFSDSLTVLPQKWLGLTQIYQQLVY